MLLLHLCAGAGIVVRKYIDDGSGVMIAQPDGARRFESLALCPHATLAPGSYEKAAGELYHAAADKCFIARTVSFRVEHEPSFAIGT